jgi:hypothetical protein
MGVWTSAGGIFPEDRSFDFFFIKNIAPSALTLKNKDVEKEKR